MRGPCAAISQTILVGKDALGELSETPSGALLSSGKSFLLESSTIKRYRFPMATGLLGLLRFV